MCEDRRDAPYLLGKPAAVPAACRNALTDPRIVQARKQVNLFNSLAPFGSRAAHLFEAESPEECN